MKALRFEHQQLQVDDVPPPAMGGEAIVRVTLSGICNTDLEIARGYAGFEGTLGHEFVGVIESVDVAPSLTVGFLWFTDPLTEAATLLLNNSNQR